jgi:Tol biopolymer transport system component
MKRAISLVLVLALGMLVRVANADFTFGEPTNLGPMVNSTSNETHPRISSDGLSLYFASDRPDGSGSYDLWVTTRVTTRSTTEYSWGEPVNLGPIVNSSALDVAPFISADGLELYFNSTRSGGLGNLDIWVASRERVDEDWSTPEWLGPVVNSSAIDGAPFISADSLELYFARGQSWNTDVDIWLTMRASVSDQWGSPVKLGPAVNGYASSVDCSPCISADGLVLFFSSTRAGGSGSYDLWMSRRDTLGEPWGEAVNLGPTVNSGFWEADSSISTDGLKLYFCDHGRPLPGGVGGGDLWQVSIIPVVDLDGDGIVDATDLCIMVDHWGENYRLCDIGPTPLGDGIVDVQDLIVLAEHLLEEVPPIEPVEAVE